MKIAIVGAGSIGKRHARNLAAFGGVELHVHDPDPRAREVAQSIGATTYSTLEELLAIRPDAAVVCTPPHLHLETARRALAAGAHLFIEKPISHQLAGIDELLAEATRAGRIVMVGYNLRFHPALKLVHDLIEAGTVGEVRLVTATAGQYLPDWRPGTDHRSGYFARPETGGGIILDGSHEIDQVRWFIGEIDEVTCLTAPAPELGIDVEGIALIGLRARGGAIAQISIDCVRRGYRRTCAVVGSEGTIEWDIDTGVGVRDDRGKMIQETAIAPDGNEMYVNELAYFLEHARSGKRPAVDGATGRRVLEIALAAHRSASTGSRIRV